MPSFMMSAYPPMALSGVRNSWLITARKSLFAWFAFTAAPRDASLQADLRLGIRPVGHEAEVGGVAMRRWFHRLSIERRPEVIAGVPDPHRRLGADQAADGLHRGRVADDATLGGNVANALP